MQYGHFLSQWKIAKIVVLQKPGKDTLYPQTFRPISLLPTVSKVFERLIHTHFYLIIQEQPLFPEYQFGFRSQYDKDAQLVRVVEAITLQFNNKGHIFDIFLDTAKAFDRVWHKGLLYKLSTF